MMPAQSNVTPTGPPSQPTSITVQPGNVGLTALLGQATTIPHAFTTETLWDFSNGAWNMDTGASSHLNSLVNSLCEIFDMCMYSSIAVGDGHSIPVTNTGHSILPTSVGTLHLKNVLITPHIIKNLIYVRQFVRNNNCTIEFDAFGFSIKDFMTRRVLLRCDSTRDLYPVTHPSSIPRAFFVSQHTRHQRLGHPGGDVLRRLVSNNVISCNNEKPPVLCHACQLGKHVRILFFKCEIRSFQCDHGREFDSRNLHKLFAENDGTLSRYKARLVANCSTQLEGVDVDENFSPVVNPILFGRHEMDATYLLLYVDDIVLTASSQPLLQQIIASLHQEFSMTDLGSFDYFLFICVTRDSSGMFLFQKKYDVEILEKAHMVNCNSSRTPIDSKSKLGADGDSISDPTLYQSLGGSLQYLTFTCPNISYVVQQVCLYMHDPREPYFLALKRVLRLVALPLGDTSGYCVFLGNNLLPWSVKRQPILSRSSADAEYYSVANVVAETCWLRNLLLPHQRTKHIEIDIHFVHDLVTGGQVHVLHVPSRYQFADIFTKGLPLALFEEFRTSLSDWCPPAPTAREWTRIKLKERKPLEKVVYSGDYDSEDEVALVDNEMSSFLAKMDGYGTQSLLEQWKESYENDDYEYDPYDNDIYEGQEIPGKLQAICDNLDITVRGRRKK
nr:ribonuclease H-like domain-containing protein [Tanacetum cinerariifolium]